MILGIIAQWSAPAAAEPTSLPESSATYGAVKSQRIRFSNTPLWQQAKDAVGRGDEAAAIRIYLQILTNDPGSNPAKLALIRLYEKQGGFSNAASICADLLGHYPGQADIWRSKGILEMKLEQFDRAAAAFENALRLEPPDSSQRRPILLDLAQAWRRAGRADDADRAYTRALDIEFTPEAALELIELRDKQGRRQDAAALAEELAKRYPDRPDVWRSKGILEMKLEQFDRAAAAFENALRLEPPDSSQRRPILLDLAQAWRRAGRADDADRAYTRALDIEFTPETALEAYYNLKAIKTPEKGRAMLERALAGNQPTALRRAALYELAQLNRQAGRTADFARNMDELVRSETDPVRLHGYAMELAGAGESDAALRALDKHFGLETDSRKKYQSAMFAANIEIQRDRVDAGKTWLNRAAPFAESDPAQAIALARADFADGEYRACAEQLLTIKNRPDSAGLLLAMSYMKRNLPGPALQFLDELRDPEALSPDERLSFFANRAYLNFGQDRYGAALQDADQALALKPSADLALLRLKALAAVAPTNDIEKEGLKLLSPQESGPRLTGPEQAQALLVIGRRLYGQEQYRHAIGRLTDAAERDPTLAEAFYVRGLAWHAIGKSAETISNFQEYARLEPRPPATFWGDLGQAEGVRRDYEKGTAALGRSLAYHSVDVDTLSDQGYQYLKWAFPHQGANRTLCDRWNHNREAQQSFERATDLYADLTPRVPTNETAVYRNREVAMKQEYTKLDRVIGFQAYVSRTDYGFPTNVGISSVDGALPSQGGLELSLRPPVVGFLNERTLDVFGNISGNFQRQSWTPDSDSYQGMIGLRLKPFIRFNYNMSFARLIKIGDNSEDNWLWRNMATWERGDKPEPGKTVALNLKGFGDFGYYFEPRTRWYCFLDARAGPCWRLHQDALLTLPQLMGILRYETNDEGDTGSYGIAGVGATLRLFEPEGHHTINRIYADIFLDYTWGQFMSTPAGFDGRSFDGPMIGVCLVK